MIIICPNDIKKEYLKEKIIHNYKFYSLSEIKEKVFFKYHDLALLKLTKKYDIKPVIASRILNSLYYIDRVYDNPRLKNLLEIKDYLISNDLIIKDGNFLNSLNDEIIIEGYPKTKELDRIISILSKYTKVTYKELKPKYSLKEIYKFHDIDLEINFVAESILKLISSGIDINKIYVVNFNDEYIGSLTRIFSLFNIPFVFKHKKKITMFKITKEFLKFIKNSDLKVSELNEFLDTLKGKNDEILNQIINVLNKYYKVNDSVKDLYEIILFDLNNTYLKDDKYRNVVGILSDIRLFDDDEYVFSISNNEVLKYKDNDYLKDSEKLLLGIDTSSELNTFEDLRIINIYSNIKNLTLSYKVFRGDNEYFISHNFENLEIKQYEFLNNSSKYNKYLFDKYNMYDNSYTEIDFEDLKKYIDGGINISSSSMEQFFKCKFRFLLNNILNIAPYEETMETKVGNMVHKILERTLKNNYENYPEIIDEEIANYLNDSPKEMFYSEKLKKDIIKIVERLKENSSKTDFKEFAFEKWLEIPLDSKLNLKLVGKIDKTLLFNDGIDNYVIVIDYKTGSYSVDIAKITNGFNMQLLIYLYLIIKSNVIKNPKIAGAYIDSVLDELKPSEYGKTYEEIAGSKLDGLTIKNHEILKHIDHYYDINTYLKGVKFKKDGDFRADARVFKESDFEKFLQVIENNINEVVKSIENCDFRINPKKYYGTKSDDIKGCEFCNFKDVCYMTAKDIKMLKKEELKDILGDEDEVDA